MGWEVSSTVKPTRTKQTSPVLVLGDQDTPLLQVTVLQCCYVLQGSLACITCMMCLPLLLTLVLQLPIQPPEVKRGTNNALLPAVT